MLCVMFEIGTVVLEIFFWNVVNVFFLFRDNLPLDMGMALNVNNPESPFPKGKGRNDFPLEIGGPSFE